MTWLSRSDLDASMESTIKRDPKVKQYSLEHKERESKREDKSASSVSGLVVRTDDATEDSRDKPLVQRPTVASLSG